MNGKVDGILHIIFFVFKIQVHLVAFMHIKFVYDEHCCVFLGMVGAILTSPLGLEQKSLRVTVLLYFSGTSCPGYV